MTKYQYKLCKKVIHYRHLNKILEKSHVDDYIELQMQLNSQLNFSDDNMDSRTIVTLQPSLQEEFETYHSSQLKNNLTLFFAGLAAIASLISASPHIAQWLQQLTQQ